MHPIAKYDTFIFDCDGVILDSNQLKIDAMRKSLATYFGDDERIDECIKYFSNNFGSSRFHHVKYFLNEVFLLQGSQKNDAYESILFSYSSLCRALYLESNLTPGVLSFISKLGGKIYVASGSEQNELRQVFEKRGLDYYFNGIYGSPVSKVELVSFILQKEKSKKAVFFGDAFSDMKAAIDNSIDFVAYLPFSNVKNELELEASKRGFSTLNSWTFS